MRVRTCDHILWINAFMRGCLRTCVLGCACADVRTCMYVFVYTRACVFACACERVGTNVRGNGFVQWSGYVSEWVSAWVPS